MPKIIVAENHEQVYPVWVEHGVKGGSLTHVDFHCDMRGIMIDRKNGEAFFTSDRETTFIDRGNFLAHAIMNGMISELNWVHGPMGGRAFDIGPVVSYESDLLAPLHRRYHKQSNHSARPLKFQESLLSNWTGPKENELLDVDWDTFASVEYDATHREALIDQFFNRDFAHIPELTTLVYSPGYSDPDRSLFKNFTNRLAQRFEATVVHLPEQPLNEEGVSSSMLRRLILGIAPGAARKVKRTLSRIYRQLESRNDLKFEV